MAGLLAQARFEPAGAGSITVGLEATRAMATRLFRAIPERPCTRGDCDGTSVLNDVLRRLVQAGTGPGVRVVLLTERAAMEQVLDLVVAGNAAQMADAAFMAALKPWIRLGAAEAQASGDGLFSAVSGAPVLPRWLASPLMDRLFTPDAVNARHARQVRSASGLAVFVSEVAVLRAQLAQVLGLGRGRPGRALHVGHGPAMPWSTRRPVEAVLA